MGSRLDPGKTLVFVQTQGHPDEKEFADVFPRYDFFFKWYGFTESHLLRACGTSPADPDKAPAAVLEEAGAAGAEAGGVRGRTPGVWPPDCETPPRSWVEGAFVPGT